MSRPKSLTPCLYGLLAVSLLVAVGAEIARWAGESEGPEVPVDVQPAAFLPVRGPSLEGGVGWLNTAGPIRLEELRGKIVLLDSWTYCCIHCHHVLPDPAKLE